ncbi:MAG: 3'-5' exonuclease [Kiritimatiellaeota bacterium]|nr:3'-5' exonuclease [Kiritimatiellota bacterium]
MLPLTLDRPLCVFDIESTGINVRSDRIIELAVIRVNIDQTETSESWLLNPGIPIPPESTAIHGITDAIVAQCPRFSDVAQEIRDFIGDSDLGGFNVARFDLPLLVEEFIRAAVFFDGTGRRVLDAQRIFHLREPRNLAAALKFFCGKEHTDAHGAEADARATLEVLCGEFERYPDLPRNVAELDEFLNPRDPFDADRAGRFRWVNSELTVNFGKKKGMLVRTLMQEEPSFLWWIVKNDFPADTRKIAEEAARGILPPPPRFKKPTRQTTEE